MRMLNESLFFKVLDEIDNTELKEQLYKVQRIQGYEVSQAQFLLKTDYEENQKLIGSESCKKTVDKTKIRTLKEYSRIDNNLWVALNTGIED